MHCCRWSSTFPLTPHHSHSFVLLIPHSLRLLLLLVSYSFSHSRSLSLSALLQVLCPSPTMRESILRSARCTFNLYLVLLLLVTLDSKRSIVDSCGVTIHNEVAFRASRILLAQPDHPTFSSCPCPQAHLGLYSASCPHLQSTIRPHWAKEKTVKSQQKALDDFVPLLAHKELLFAGSFFPDWGYNCIGKIWNNVAEEVNVGGVQ